MAAPVPSDRLLPRGVRRLALALGAPLLLAGGAAAAVDLPRFKAGLWEITQPAGRGQAAPPSKTTLCLDDSVQREMHRMATGMMQQMCSRNDMRVAAGRVESEAVCDLGGSTMRSKAVLTMSGETAYRTETRATFDPPFMGQTESHAIIEGRHVGPCRPGQNPGDMTLPAGQTINIRSLADAPAKAR